MGLVGPWVAQERGVIEIRRSSSTHCVALVRRIFEGIPDRCLGISVACSVAPPHDCAKSGKVMRSLQLSRIMRKVLAYKYFHRAAL